MTGWILDGNRLVLDAFDDNGQWIYEMDLERCRTSAEVLAWMA